MPGDKRFPYVTFPLLPPLLAIALCMATGQVLPGLFLGIWVGALMYSAYNPAIATYNVLDWYVKNATDPWNAGILLFDFVIGAWVGLLYASGTIHALANVLLRGVKTSRRAGLMSTILGTIVFFDDYTNTVIVGNVARPVTDRLRVSRELLSYIVDSTAAPVAGLLFISTWIGFEVSQINGALTSLQKAVADGKIPVAPDLSAYSMWLSALPYHFYSLLAVTLVYIVVLTRRHFGPMLKAEWRAYKEGKVLRDGASPLMPTEEVLGAGPASRKQVSHWLFIVSVLVLLGMALIGMWATGAEELERFWETPFMDALSNADSSKALLLASFSAYMVTLAWILADRAMSLAEAIKWTIRGMYLMVYANAILLHAWTIKTATDLVGTADFVVHSALAAGVPVVLVPLVIFLASMFIAYTTGTSWGTFGIMMPMAVPMAWTLALSQFNGNVDIAYTMTFATIGAVFGGAIYGDHVSPISDTTIMSSMFSACDHIDHVNTQLPYGTLAAFTSILLYVLFALGVASPIILIPVGIVLLIIFHYLLSELYAKKTGLPPIVPDYKAS
ncbi:Na+/H+ antiporter NhaC family protein [Desulfurococcus sp.]|uniref:Na+/H+ antiporter NhaC family protein n=3 Tax=Desulfurococcus sp. TaxID=51678 RepID=UPI00319E50EE